MRTIKALCDELAVALGMSPRALAFVGNDLAGADMIGNIDEPATVEDAARILVAACGDFDVRAPWCAVRSFWDLPLVTVQTMTEAEGTVCWETLQADDPYAASIREVYGKTFGEVLVNVIADVVAHPGLLYESQSIQAGRPVGENHVRGGFLEVVIGGLGIGNILDLLDAELAQHAAEEPPHQRAALHKQDVQLAEIVSVHRPHWPRQSPRALSG